MLENIGVDDKELRLIQNLYFDQIAAMRVKDNISEWTQIRKGVRQGCVMSPDLFSLYSEMILRTIENEPGVKIGGQNLSNLRYADDTVLLADSEDKLQNLINIVNEQSKKYGMELNEKKTETMVITKKREEDTPTCKIKVNGTSLKQVKSFKYLGTTITWNVQDETEVNIRIAQAKSAFNQMRSILCNKNISFKTRYRVLHCYVYPIFDYNAETWTLNKRTADRINAFEMWTLRRMMRISYLARKSNAQVLEMAKQDRALLRNIRRKQLKFVGHVLRKGRLEHLSLSGRIEGKRARGRQRGTFLQQFRHPNSNSVIQLACDRKVWKEFTDEAINAWNQAG